MKLLNFKSGNENKNNSVNTDRVGIKGTSQQNDSKQAQLSEMRTGKREREREWERPNTQDIHRKCSKWSIFMSSL